MKKILLSTAILLFFLSCSKDDGFIPITIPQCTTPTNIQASNITFESATVSWESTNSSASYTIEYGVSGFSQGSGTTATVSNTSATLNNLSSNTTYEVYVQAICSTDNVSMISDVYSFTTAAPLVVPQFLPNLSELNLFSGALGDLVPSVYVFQYDLNTPLFTDYAHKQRLIALPPGTSMAYVDSGFPDFPDNTLIAKTFYYYNDERDETLGTHLIETRVLIKINGTWEYGNYKWNDDQSDAVLDTTTGTVAVSYTDSHGDPKNINYVIPSANDCVACHSKSSNITPIGPKLRSLNFNNQLEDLIASNYLSNLDDASTVATLPNWEDTSYTLEQRARAYFDVNCAHCHSDGGYCEVQSTLRLGLEVPFEDSNIFERRMSIESRMGNYIQGFSMPLLGTTMVHDEGYALIRNYLNSL